MKIFLQKKINLILNSKISIEQKENNEIKFFNNKKILNFDYLVWAANPVIFLKTLGFGVLDNPTTRVKVFASNIKILSEPPLKNFFIQVYYSKSNVFRIFFYKINDTYKITVETYFDKNEKRTLSQTRKGTMVI